MIVLKRSNILLLSIGIAFIPDVSLAMSKDFMFGWHIGQLDAICGSYKVGKVDEKWAYDYFKGLYPWVEKNVSKEYLKEFYSYGNTEDTKQCKKFVPK